MLMENAISMESARKLLTRYTTVIDDGQLVEWPQLFTVDAHYRITTREIMELGQPLSIMLCTSKGMLFDRIEATEKANLFEPHHYRHVLSDSVVVNEAEQSIELVTNFFCSRTMLNGDSMLFVTGRYIDEIVQEEGQLLFRSKTVVLDQSKIDTLIAIPL